jgi:hypothetical protein
MDNDNAACYQFYLLLPQLGAAQQQSTCLACSGHDFHPQHHHHHQDKLGLTLLMNLKYPTFSIVFQFGC